MRPQVNHDVEGSSKVRTRSGSVARGNKAKHPQLDVEESAPKRTRSGGVARGIKAKHPRSRKHRDVKGEIRETVYRASLNGIKTLIEEVNLSDDHKKIMMKTQFWNIFKFIIENKLTSAHCRISDKMIIRIINAYDPDTGGFKLGDNTIRITRDDIFGIFGITGGSEKVSFKYGSREGVEMVRRGSIEAERLSSSSLKELVKEYAVRNNKAGRQDFVRLLCAYLLHSLFFPAETTVKWVYLERVEDLVRLRNYHQYQQAQHFGTWFSVVVVVVVQYYMFCILKRIVQYDRIRVKIEPPGTYFMDDNAEIMSIYPNGCKLAIMLTHHDLFTCHVRHGI